MISIKHGSLELIRNSPEIDSENFNHKYSGTVLWNLTHNCWSYIKSMAFPYVEYYHAPQLKRKLVLHCQDSNEEFEVRYPETGYHNGRREAAYFTRKPVRAYKQGITEANSQISFNFWDSLPKELAKELYYLSPWSEHGSSFISRVTSICSGDRYPTLKEIQDQFASRSVFSRAINKYFMLSLSYKDSSYYLLWHKECIIGNINFDRQEITMLSNHLGSEVVDALQTRAFKIIVKD